MGTLQPAASRSKRHRPLIKTSDHGHAMPVHIIHVAPARTPGKFAAFLGERQIVAARRTPFCDGARALLAEGTAAPGDLLVMRHAGGEHDALKAAVGVAAKLTVSEETNPGRPRFVSWTPHPKAPPMLSGDAPMRETGVQALIYRSAKNPPLRV